MRREFKRGPCARATNIFLNGTKSWVTIGGDAGICIAFAKTDPSAGAKGITAFLVEPTFPGFRVARQEDKMGMRLSHSAEISLQDCRVPEENRLGEEGTGLKIALEALDGGRVGMAAQAVGLRKALWKRPRGMRSSAARSGKRSANFRRFNGCWPTCKRKSKRRAG